MTVCGATTTAGKQCQRPAGWGTAHVGDGRCKLHGGNAGRPIKTGLRSRYAAIRRPRIKELIESFEKDPDPENLLPEVQLLRALILDYVERYDEQTEGLMAWHASFNPLFDKAFAEWQNEWSKWSFGYQSWKDQWEKYREEVERVQHYYKGGWPEPPGIEVYDAPPEPPAPIDFQQKPREVPDILSVGKFITAIGGLVERIQKARTENVITLLALQEIMQQFGRQMYDGVTETISDDALRAAVLEAVEGRWSSITLPDRKTG